jgi:hypothetical protein
MFFSKAKDVDPKPLPTPCATCRGKEDFLPYYDENRTYRGMARCGCKRGEELLRRDRVRWEQQKLEQEA